MATRGSGDVRQGMTVYDVDGDKIGSVDELAGGGASYMKVKTGLLGLGGHWYIPVNAVREVRSDAVYLNVDKDDAERLGWSAPPTAASQGQRATAAPTGSSAQEGRTVRLREEELRAEKTPVQTGEVGIRKDVVTEQKTVEVPVTHEEVVVERHPVEGRPAAKTPVGTGDEEIRVPVQEEQVRLEKQPTVYEEVNVRKQPVTETERVSGTVRKEEARVEKEGDVDVRGDTPPREKR